VEGRTTGLPGQAGCRTQCKLLPLLRWAQHVHVCWVCWGGELTPLPMALCTAQRVRYSHSSPGM